MSQQPSHKFKMIKKQIDADGDRIIKPLSSGKVLHPKKSSTNKKPEANEILDIPLPFKLIGEQSSLTDLHDLLKHSPPPQPPLTAGEIKLLTLDVSNAMIMREQIRLMKSSMDKLQKFLKDFCSTKTLKDDVDFIVANVKSTIAKSEYTQNTKK